MVPLDCRVVTTQNLHNNIIVDLITVGQHNVISYTTSMSLNI